MTEASGLEFVHRTGFDGHHWFPEIVAGGAGIADFDGDGRNDVVLIDGGRLPEGPPGEHVVFRNVGEGRFEPAARLPGAAYGQGVAIGDVDGDGDPDLYVTNVGPNQLFRNDGDFRFVDRSNEAGAADRGWSTSAA
ncbi:MAG: VCBS repeat-containing protein, partial [Gemmatimonadetes bacterium]|nr:VCBS repeat-containing protein [Gemmatimonadota bacterium]